MKALTMHAQTGVMSLRLRSAVQRGFTLIELLVVLVLLSIMLLLAAPGFMTFQRNSELTSTANSFVAALSAARAEAMKRQLRAFVIPGDGSSASSDWATGWTVFVDVDSNVTSAAVLPGSGDIIVSRQGAMPASVAVNASVDSTAFTSGGVTYAMFNGSGFMTLIGGSFPTNGVHALDITNATETRRIIANTTGRLRVCRPADAGCNITDSL
jgi:type IV fimbrial biogenesis protein FimT